MPMTQPPLRAIIKDFQREIDTKKVRLNPHQKVAIAFRNEVAENKERTVYKVPIELLWYRKENGRIASSVMSHERVVGPLYEQSPETRDIIAEFLREKDPEITEELKTLLLAEGQREPAIITCDGFLINGNRRRLALSELKLKYPANDTFKWMHVVILPGPDDEGGPPTLLEIEQIENRYQLQADGKAAYYGFDAALSMREKEKRGFTLESQLRDDPMHRDKPEKEFKKVLRETKKKFLAPLECVDRYLETIGRPGQYACISSGRGDPEGRWQAFVDYAESFASKIGPEATARARAQNLAKMDLEPNETGVIEQAAFKAIRLRDIPSMPKVHLVMRKLPDMCKHGKKQLKELDKDVKHDFPEDETRAPDGTPLPQEKIDENWEDKYRETISYRLKRASGQAEDKEEQNKPIALLNQALQKLTHENMADIDKISLSDLSKAEDIAEEIKKTIKDLASRIFELKKSYNKLQKGASKPRRRN